MILYKLGQNGMLVWEGKTQGATLGICHGHLTGALQSEIIDFPSPEEAETELLRRYNKKRDREGYTVEQPTKKPPMPMLATNYHEHHSKLPLIVIVQPKLDGIRCIGSCEGLFTRRNERITSMPHISTALKYLPPGIVLDGELYSKGTSFQTILSLVKRDYPSTKGINTICYHVFDIINDNPFETRAGEYTYFCDLVGWPLIPVPINTGKKADIPIAFNHWKELGGEGVMIRDPHSHYEPNKRSYGLQKYKEFITEEYEIVSITAADKGREKGAAIFVLQSASGKKFRARPKLSIAQRCLVYRNRESFKGYWTRITYQELTALGVPRQPIAEGLEPDKDSLN
jgi:ATP-dependent DNA ligase